MAMTRALRRHHSQRIKNNRKGYWFANNYDAPDLVGRQLGLAARTPKPCGCMMCRNPRTYEGLSLKERSQNEVDYVVSN